jgi:hypothetical protein
MENDKFLLPIENIQALSKLQGDHKMWVKTLNSNINGWIAEKTTRDYPHCASKREQKVTWRGRRSSIKC